MVETIGIPAHGYGTRDARDYMRVRGDTNGALVETAPSYSYESVDWVGELVPVAVSVLDGKVTISASEDLISDVSRRCLESMFRAALRDAGLVIPERGKRYVAGPYVALDRAEAERLAAINRNPIVVSDADILHCTPEWCFWSDGKFTTSCGLPAWAKKVRSLAPAAVDLITSAYGSDSGQPTKVGGYKALAEVTSYTETRIDTGPSRGYYAPAKVDRLDLTLLDGSVRTIYRYTAGYCEGYAYELGNTLDDVLPRATTAEVD